MKVKHLKPLETGISKTVSEAYIVNALTVGDAEARAVGFFTDEAFTDFEITDIVKQRIASVSQDGGECWYRAMLRLTTEDERTGREKQAVETHLILADGFNRAVSIAREICRECGATIADTAIAGITEAGIEGIIPTGNDSNTRTAAE